MRILFFVFLFIYSIGYGQNITFSKVYNPCNKTNTNSLGNCIQSDGSGYITVSVGGDSVNPNRNIVILNKLDSLGNILKTVFFRSAVYNYWAGGVSSLVKTSDSAYFIACSKEYTSNNSDHYLVKFNSDLDTIWTKTIDHDSIWEIYYNSCETFDKGFAMVGLRIINSNSWQILLHKTDSMGNKLWEKAINIGGLSGADRILETPDKGFLICGYKTSNVQGVGDPLILKTDSAGNLLWYKFLGGNEKDGAASIAITPQGDYLVAYGYSTYTYPMNQYWAARLNIIKYSSDGVPIWNKMYDTIRINYTVFNIQVLPNNDFFVIGSCVDKGNYFFLPTFFFKINNNGDSLYKKIYFYSDTYYDGNFLKDNIQTSDGGIIGIGNVLGDTIVPYQKIWILKTDSNGYAPGPHNFLRVEECINNKLISIFPNPATTQTTITYPTAEKDIMLQIYNMLGQLVYEEKLSKGSKQTTINTTTFKRGIYKITLGEYSNTLIINNE